MTCAHLPCKVQVRHSGQTREIEIDVSKGPLAFKHAIYEITGVPVERMKVMVKGTVLKDNTNLAALAIKPVIGTPGPLPAPPSEPTVFRQFALASGNPPGLVNLGQTCYLNSTLQALRAVPHLDDALTTLQCNDAPNEAQTLTTERVLKLECNISMSTNFLLSGITEVRFYWRRDIQKKAKIMRKVKFPLRLDVLDLPSNALAKQILAERDDRYKSAKRTGSMDTGNPSRDESIRSKEQDRFRELVGSFDRAENPSGMYELSAMITHKGASADSGEEDWFKFDDDKVTTVKA
ncbi:hypothetical protein IAU59_004890 [Kwoniella sp. CBS 9459]